MAKKQKHVEAIFHFDENVSQLLTDAQAFYAAVAPAGAMGTGSPAGAGSVYVTFTVAQISTALLHLAACRTAESEVTQRTKGTAPARDLTLAAVITDLHNFVATVQISVNNAPDLATAKAIVGACALHTRKDTHKTKAPFNVKNDHTTAGEVDFIFKAAAKGLRASYEIQVSTDNLTWVTIKVTPDSRSKFLHGKPSGTKLYFRGRIILGEKKGGAQEWLIPPVAFIYVL